MLSTSINWLGCVPRQKKKNLFPVLRLALLAAVGDLPASCAPLQGTWPHARLLQGTCLLNWLIRGNFLFVRLLQGTCLEVRLLPSEDLAVGAGLIVRVLWRGSGWHVSENNNNKRIFFLLILALCHHTGLGVCTKRLLLKESQQAKCSSQRVLNVCCVFLLVYQWLYF